ncbi:MAG: hypothetical protein Q9196_001817, partial [Gyalolechia fulgens]
MVSLILANRAPVDLDGEAAQVQQRSTHLNKKRQDSDGCQNLGCPAGYIPSMDGGVCYCGIDGGFPYPQSPASMGPQGMDAFGADEEDMSS